MDIRHLVIGAQMGNAQDFDALVHLFYHKVYSTIRSMVSDEALAEDVVQDVFIRAWTSIHALKEAAAFPSWLWSIAANQARSSLRRQARERAVCC